MGLVQKITGYFKRKPVGPTVNAEDVGLQRLDQGMVDQIDAQIAARRRFVEHDRLNQADWLGANGQSINEDLETDLPVLMARCAHAFATNPIFEGICNTYCQDVVGPHGPTLKINSDDPVFNEEVEWAWRQVFAAPDPSGRLGGVENMRMWVRLLLTAGSFINVFTERRRDQTEVRFAWRTIHPRRLITPMSMMGDPNVAFGQRLDPQTGAPTRYYIDKPQRLGGSEISGLDYQEFPADMVQHRYLAVEPEQLTGYPMMSSTLKTLAEISRLDGYTMEAAQAAAWADWWLKSSDPSKAYSPDPLPAGPIKVSKGAVNVAPPGWEPVGGQSSQPSAQGILYRHERLAECGRPINMPLLIVLLSVNDATFSSAQFAGALYIDGIRGLQGYLQREVLNPLLEIVITELVLSGRVRRPEWYEKLWTHNVPPHANIEKLVSAVEKMVAMGAISLPDASAWFGFDFEEVLARRKKAQDDLEAANLPLPPSSAPPEPAEPPTGDDEPAPATKKERADAGVSAAAV